MYTLKSLLMYSHLPQRVCSTPQGWKCPSGVLCTPAHLYNVRAQATENNEPACLHLSFHLFTPRNYIFLIKSKEEKERVF